MSRGIGPELGMRGLWRCQACGASRIADGRPHNAPILVVFDGDPMWDPAIGGGQVHACSPECESMLRLGTPLVEGLPVPGEVGGG